MSHHYSRRTHHGSDDERSEHHWEHTHNHGREHQHYRFLDEVHHHRRKHSSGDNDDEQKPSKNVEPPQSLNFKNHDIYSSLPGATAAGLNGSGANVTDKTDAELKALGQTLANYADEVATALGTVGDCAHGPRLSLTRLGLNFAPAVATDQGVAIRNSGFFNEVSRDQVRPGDYGVRDWSPAVVRAHHGDNKGDSFIVTKVDASGQLYGANDHHLKVPEDGERYRNLKFYRLNEKFLRLYDVTSSNNA
ncbi:MAG: hypothetical protein P4L53_03620 [Candidatus Obscuribacterales bacterium]|nr:hypothetical protein [Candidatus Obscuribacterales bacterium]